MTIRLPGPHAALLADTIANGGTLQAQTDAERTQLERLRRLDLVVPVDRSRTYRVTDRGVSVHAELRGSPHILVVTRACWSTPIDDAHLHDQRCLAYRISCPGVTESSGCREWGWCATCTQAHRVDLEHAATTASSRVRNVHGAQHRLDDGVWVVVTGNCWLAGHPQMPDVAATLDLNGPGGYFVEFGGTCDDDLTMSLFVFPDGGAT